ncbi:MAG: hypothetical protein R3F20_07820 [Planctomycetota bacterium]
MRARRGLMALAPLAALAAVLFGGTGGGDAEAAADRPLEEGVVFALDRIEDHPREGVAEKMFAFLVDVDENGAPVRLDRCFLLRGIAPDPRPTRDLSRTYAFDLLDSRGRVLASGLHHDRIAVYVPLEDGGCEKSVVGAHPVMIRTAWVEGATALRLTIVGHTDEHEEHDHR